MIGGPQPALAPLSFGANFVWVLVGNVVTAACQWGMVVALSKLGSPEVVGRFALGYAVTAPVMVLANLGLAAVQATDARRVFRFGEFLTLRLVTATLAMAAIVGIALLAGYSTQASVVIVVVGLAKALEAVSDVYHGLMQQRERMDRIAKSMILKGFLSLVALVGVLFLTGSLIWAMGGVAVVMALRLFMYDIPGAALVLDTSEGAHCRESARQQSMGRHTGSWAGLRMERIGQLAVLAAPLGLAGMIDSLHSNVPRLVIERQLGEHGLGLFSAMAYLMVAGMTVVAALGQSASPRLARYFAEGDRRAYTRLLLGLVGGGMMLGLGGVLVAAVAGAPLLKLIYRAEYAAEASVLVWLMGAAAMSYVASFLGYGMTAAHCYRVQPLVLGAALVAASTVCLMLVPLYGLVGGAFGLLAGYSTQALAESVCIIRVLRRLPRLRRA